MTRLAHLYGTAVLVGTLMSGCGGGLKQQDAPTPPASLPTGSCGAPPSSSLTVNVKNSPYGAKGDGVTDDSSAIQKAVDAVAGTGGTVTVPAGIFMVNPVINSSAGIRLGSNMTLSLDSGARLTALPTSTSDYVVVLLNGVQNVTIRGGTIQGNRDNNTIADASEGGLGVAVVNSQHIVLEGVTARDCWADGFYVGRNSRDVTLCTVVADNNRRNGMSITSVDGLMARGCTFKNSTGSIEKGVWVNGLGINIEPNLGETVNNAQFLGCAFTANADSGFGAGPAGSNAGTAFVTNLVVDGGSASGNGLREGGGGIALSNTSSQKITNNLITDNLGNGIYLRNGANNNLIKGNTVSATKAAPPPGDIGYGILLYVTSGNTVTGNTVTANAACGIRDAYPSGANLIGSNTLNSNHPDVCP